MLLRVQQIKEVWKLKRDFNRLQEMGKLLHVRRLDHE